ncbi:MAG: hypothetical protein DYH06_11875 [Acidobacteria bacterium ACB2]|nr:hypothetical protein [Acidobacteria bacterium ACB2]
MQFVRLIPWLGLFVEKARVRLPEKAPAEALMAGPFVAETVPPEVAIPLAEMAIPVPFDAETSRRPKLGAVVLFARLTPVPEDAPLSTRTCANERADVFPWMSMPVPPGFVNVALPRTVTAPPPLAWRNPTPLLPLVTIVPNVRVPEELFWREMASVPPPRLTRPKERFPVEVVTRIRWFPDPLTLTGLPKVAFRLDPVTRIPWVPGFVTEVTLAESEPATFVSDTPSAGLPIDAMPFIVTPRVIPLARSARPAWTSTSPDAAFSVPPLEASIPAWPSVLTVRLAKEVTAPAWALWSKVSAVPPARRTTLFPSSTVPVKATVEAAVGPVTEIPVDGPSAATAPERVTVPPERPWTSTARPAFDFEIVPA